MLRSPAAPLWSAFAPTGQLGPTAMRRDESSDRSLRHGRNVKGRFSSHAIYMDPLRKPDWVRSSEAEMEGTRKAMGHARRFAERMRLAAMKPRPELASTRFCIGDPGKEYVVYQPKSGGEFSVELPPGSYRTEWFHPARGETVSGENFQAGGGAKRFRAPFEGDSVLCVKSERK